MPPITYDELRREGIIGPPLNEASILATQFHNKVYERFEKCKNKLNSMNTSVASITFPQNPTSEILLIALGSTSSSYIFDKDYRIYKKPQQKVFEFIAICPFRYQRNYVDNPAKIFDYLEIHTSREIKTYLYDVEQFNPGGHGDFFNTRHKIIEVRNCLALTRALDAGTIEETCGKPLLEQMKEKLNGNSMPLEDFYIIAQNPNNKFLSTILAYGILAYSMNRFETFRSDTSVPFLLVIDCSSIKRNKNYSDIQTYIKKIHEACYMPDGSYGTDFPPKNAKAYEEYLNRPHLARKVPLIEAANDFKVEEAFPAFYDSINKSTFAKQKYPYGSLPLIITEKGDNYPEKYFFKLNAGDIVLDNEAVQKSLSLVLEVITYITQSACVGLEKYAINPSFLTYGSSFELASIDPSVKCANDKLYMARILATSLCIIHRARKVPIEPSEYIINGIAQSVFSGKDHQIWSAIKPIASTSNKPIDALLQHIAEDLNSCDVFDTENPKTKEDFAKVEFAFLYNDMLCFKRQKDDKTIANTFEKYLRERAILTDGTTMDEIWNELGEEPYQVLTNRNSNKYYKYNVRNGPTGNVYAFKISALKEYVSRLSQ